MTTWAHIQKLAADLQRVQLAEGTRSLSDGNCVELVSMLLSHGQVELVVTTDGKEYVTRKHLVTECANECLAAGGRIPLTELAAQLNVDLDHVQTAINQLLNQQQSREGLPAEFVVCAGELINRDFINVVCAKINARLQELGHISMLQLTKQWDLSTEILNQYILPEIGAYSGTRISAIRFEDQLCTPQCINALRGKLIAILTALTKPIALSNIHSHLGVSQTLFFKIWTELSDGDKLPGKLLGSKNSLKSLFIPSIHENLANYYIKQKIAIDHFIECVVFKRLSIPTEPKAFFREFLPTKEFQDLIFWPSVILSESKLWKECDLLAKNLLQSNHYYLLEDILPSQFTFLTQEDHSRIIERLQKHGNGSNLRATEDQTIVFEQPQLVENWLERVDNFVHERAEKDAPELRKAQFNAALATKKEGQQQKTLKGELLKEDWELDRPGKKGKGAGKKDGSAGKSAKRRGEADAQNQNDPLLTHQLSAAELFAELRRAIDTDIPDPLCRALEEDFATEANKLYKECIAEAWQKVDSGEIQEQRRAYEQKVEKISDAYSTICVYEKGIEAFDESLSGDLYTFLLRTLCAEFAQSLLHTLADPSAPSAPYNFTIKLREQLIASLESKEMQKLTKKLFDALDNMEHFHDAVQQLSNQAGIMLRQPDKKERSDRLEALGAELRSQLTSCADPPTLLLLAILLFLQRYNGLAVHASGKFVSPLIEFIASKPGSSDQSFHKQLVGLLADTQRLVVASIKKKRTDERRRNIAENDGEQQLEKELAERMEQLKALFETNK